MSKETYEGKADKAAGKFQELGGKAREGIAHLTGDDEAEAYAKKDQANGLAKQAKGTVKEAWGKTKDAVKDAVS